MKGLEKFEDDEGLEDFLDDTEIVLQACAVRASHFGTRQATALR